MNVNRKFKLSRNTIKGVAVLLLTATVLNMPGKTISANVGTVKIISPELLVEMTQQPLQNEILSGTNINELFSASNDASEIISLSSSTNLIASTKAANTSISASNKLSKYGTFTIPGMSKADYNSAMDQKWVEVIPKGKPVNMNIDLTKSYSYEKMEAIMKNLAKYDGVNLYIIGQTEEGRNMYSLNIDFGSDLTLDDGEMVVSEEGKKKEILLCTGQIHAREFAGSIFILKQFNDMIEKAQTDEYTASLLQNVIYVAIPCVNPDGREAIINGASSSKKSNGNGIDLNRNFPAMNAGQLTKGTSKSTVMTTKPGNGQFGGYKLGSESETQTVMKWMNFFVAISTNFLDYHQQGGGGYAKKGWDTKTSQSKYVSFANNIFSYLNSNVSSNRYTIFSEAYSGLDGIGGTITDYAASIAMGMEWSTSYGRMVLKDNKGKDIPLVVYKNLDNSNYNKYYNPANSSFATTTIEIGRGTEALGYGQNARNLMASEYKKYNFGGLLQYRAELALGKTKVKKIKNQISEANTSSIYDEETDYAMENGNVKVLSLKH